ncbi:MAG: LLM class flavin-dependent oxidoreductase [Proteobacteria bacterium]|nr:LLM class flavin-dependent oxidoreductase [Pseudomonadota bacterium]
MKFGVLQFFSWPGKRVPLDEVYRRALERVRIMDQTGYDCVWLAEHHFSTYSVCPSVHMMGMHIAGMTKNLRIGTGVSLAAMYHPLRLAEEVALLDVLSEGRVNWGAGRGFDATEFQVFGIEQADSQAKFHENVQIVLKAWKNETFTHHGKYYDFDNIEVLPKPFQSPHPPVWMAASSMGSVTWAAEQGFAILMDPHSGHADIGLKFDHYVKTLAASGHGEPKQSTPMARLLAVDPNPRKAEAIARAGAEWTVGSYAGKAKASLSAKPTPDADGGDPIERYMADTIIYGTPDAVVDKLHELQETISLDYLLCNPLSHSTFTEFTESVLPKFT